MKTTKKILAVVLSVMLLLSVMPFAAFATDVSFTKVTDASQITAENIGTCTNEEAKAWALANWDDVHDDDHRSYIAFYSNTGVLNVVVVYKDFDEEDFSDEFERTTSTKFSIGKLQQRFGDGGPIFICTPAAPAPTYTVTWKNADGTTLETDTDVVEGTVPTYDKATPTKADDAQYTYTFAGWTPEVVAATQDVTYTAQFTPVAKFSVFVKKLTGGTITVSNVTGLTTVAQLKDLLVTETGVPASAMRLIFAGKQLEDDKTLGEYNIQKESTIHLVIRTYTITWKSDENTVIDTTNVAYGETPTHVAPADYEDADYTYTFEGWTPEVVAATADATYTATYTATPKANNGVNLTVGNDITSNYYVDYSKYTGAQKIRYSYNCVNELEQNVQDGATIALDEIPDEMKDATSGRFVLEVSQAPAQMAEPTVIEILGENDVVLDTLNYSAKTYCDKVIGMTVEQLAALPDVGTTEKAEELQTLCHTMIAYGQAAQGVFADYDTTKVYCENADVNAQIEAATPEANYSVDNSGMIKFSGVSFVCTKDARLRFYLNTSEATSTPAAPTASTGNAALKYTLNGAEKQYFVEVSGINAADFNEQITVNYGGSTINFSVLDFAGIVLRDGSGASAALQHFAKTLVVYNTNALAFFGN